MSAKLQELRAQIDQIDSGILDLLKERFEATKKVGEVKSLTHQSVLQKDRWQAILEKLRTEAEAKGLPYEMIQKIWNTIHNESQKQEKLIIDTDAKS